MAQLKHDYQEANRCADVLGRNAMTQELGFIIFDVCSSLVDFVGVKYPRLIFKL